MVHYGSDKNQDFLELFNKKLYREFYSNEDYELLGGQETPSKDAHEELNALQSLQKIDQFLTKRNKKNILKSEMSSNSIHQNQHSKGSLSTTADPSYNHNYRLNLQTSVLGTLNDQKLPMLENQKLLLSHVSDQQSLST